jgi:hypothetical protein
MNSSLLFRRSVAVLASAGATTALALIPSTAAHASVKAEFVAEGEASAQYVGPTVGGTCTKTSGNQQSNSSGVTFHHGTKRQSVNLGATFTSSDNSADQVKVKGHVKSALTIKRKHGDLSSLDFSADAAVTVSNTVSGSACRGSGETFAMIPLMSFTEAKKGKLNVSFTTSKPNALIEFIVFSYKTEEPIMEVVNVGDRTQGTSQMTLKPGKYAIAETQIGAFSGSIAGKSASLSHKTSRTVEVTASFTPKTHHHHHHH